MIRKTNRFLFSLLLVFATVSLLGGCKGKGPALARVGSSAITDGDLDALARVNPRLKPRLSTPAGKQKILENYVEQELMYQESLRRALDRNAAVKEKLELYDKIIIAQALLDDELDVRVREYYNNHKDEFERVRISHIFVASSVASSSPADKQKTEAEKGRKKPAEKSAKRSEAEALKAIGEAKARLARGEDFGKAVKEVSEDDKTKENQGDLGYTTIHDKRLERLGWLPLAEKAFALKPGEVSDPIKTADGYHLVKVTEEKKVQSFEEADPSIRFRLQSDIRTDLIESLKKRYKVEYAKSAAAPETAPSTPAETAPTTAPHAQ